jgi:hypothetical protein
MYRPLPEFLVIKESTIEGRGLFTTSSLAVQTKLGISHVYDDRACETFPDNLIRTPLGGFINHSESPNCNLVKTGRLYLLWTTEDILADCELTLKYSITKYL